MRRVAVGVLSTSLLSGCATTGHRAEALAGDAITVQHASPAPKPFRSWRWFFEKCEPESGECRTDWKGVWKVTGAVVGMCVLFWPRDHMQNPNLRNQDASTPQ